MAHPRVEQPDDERPDRLDVPAEVVAPGHVSPPAAEQHSYNFV